VASYFHTHTFFLSNSETHSTFFFGREKTHGTLITPETNKVDVYIQPEKGL